MKQVLLILFFAPLLSTGQKLALIDRSFQHPISIADTITMEDATKGMVPVYSKDIYSVVNTIQWLIKHMNSEKLSKEGSFDLAIGNSKCIVKTEKNAGINKYNIVLNTSTDNFKTSIVLVNHEGGKRAIQRLAIFMDYLRNNISVLPALHDNIN